MVINIMVLTLWSQLVTNYRLYSVSPTRHLRYDIVNHIADHMLQRSRFCVNKITPSTAINLSISEF